MVVAVLKLPSESAGQLIEEFTNQVLELRAFHETRAAFIFLEYFSMRTGKVRGEERRAGLSLAVRTVRPRAIVIF